MPWFQAKEEDGKLIKADTAMEIITQTGPWFLHLCESVENRIVKSISFKNNTGDVIKIEVIGANNWNCSLGVDLEVGSLRED